MLQQQKTLQELPETQERRTHRLCLRQRLRHHLYVATAKGKNRLNGINLLILTETAAFSRDAGKLHG
jgi:hypothetical protein